MTRFHHELQADGSWTRTPFTAEQEAYFDKLAEDGAKRAEDERAKLNRRAELVESVRRSAPEVHELLAHLGLV